MNTLILQAALASLLLVGQAEEKLFVASPLTMPQEFTPGIEGPACDQEGNILAVNFAKQGTIGRVTPSGKGEVFLELPGDSVGNGIRFDRDGFMYIADYVRRGTGFGCHAPARAKAAALQASGEASGEEHHLPVYGKRSKSA